jgi:hypothetical protein
MYFLPAAVVPAVIYLIFRKKPRKVVFSSLFLMKDISRKMNRRTRIKDIILLILRTLAVLSVILLFAVPYSGAAPGSGQDMLSGTSQRTTGFIF